jgi:hypothetical protein
MVGAISAAMVLAMLCLRLGWRRRREWVMLGWALAIAAATLAIVLWDMWGLAVASLVAIGAALVLLAREGMLAPAATRPLRPSASVTAPRWRLDGLARRVSVFLLVVPAGFAATLLLALGVDAVARRGGVGEADATVLALMVQPIGWAVLASVQLLVARPRRMMAPALLCAGLGGAMLWA